MIHLASIFNQTFADLHWCANKLRKHKNMEYRTGNNMEHKRTRKKKLEKFLLLLMSYTVYEFTRSACLLRRVVGEIKNKIKKNKVKQQQTDRTFVIQMGTSVTHAHAVL